MTASNVDVGIDGCLSFFYVPTYLNKNLRFISTIIMIVSPLRDKIESLYSKDKFWQSFQTYRFLVISFGAIFTQTKL